MLRSLVGSEMCIRDRYDFSGSGNDKHAAVGAKLGAANLRDCVLKERNVTVDDHLHTKLYDAFFSGKTDEKPESNKRRCHMRKVSIGSFHFVLVSVHMKYRIAAEYKRYFPKLLIMIDQIIDEELDKEFKGLARIVAGDFNTDVRTIVEEKMVGQHGEPVDTDPKSVMYEDRQELNKQFEKLCGWGCHTRA
eukprot:TRINITY_DN45256_c0_g1_i1.p1 TRINITY_DN45256_c0_g1~~TRINITY_DN45256_c0_g1_i1.p1  ORF type:complete len:191 (+),score=30.59 TRINITY_DN45256_c0_g1_i1:75-647(+)